MKIVAIKSWKENLELIRPYTIAFKTVSSVENCFVAIRLEDGTIGLGAANPSKQVVGEDIHDTERILNEENLEWIIGQDIRLFQEHCHEVSKKYASTPAACAALDMALYDAFCQHLGVPVVDFLGRKIEALPTSITIGIKSVSESIEEAKEYIGRGFKILKVKTGKSLEEDIEVLTKIRENINSSIKIRVDANQGYNADDLMMFMNQARELSLGIELVEQPLPADAVGDMKDLPNQIKKYVAADESLLSPADALHLISGEPACQIFNIKLMKCGGISNGKVIANIAENSSIDLMWGCNDESIISISAALHTAFSSSQTKYIDLDGSLDLAKDVVEGGFEINDGMMRPSGEAGLGLKFLRKEYLEEF